MAIIDGRVRNLVKVVVFISRSAEHMRSIRRSLIRTNDEFAQEFVAQTIEIVTVELCVRSLFEVCLCFDS